MTPKTAQRQFSYDLYGAWSKEPYQKHPVLRSDFFAKTVIIKIVKSDAGWRWRFSLEGIYMYIRAGFRSLG